MVVIALVTKLNFNASRACSEKKKKKNSALSERIKTATSGSRNNPKIKTLGRMNIHFESESFFKVAICHVTLSESEGSQRLSRRFFAATNQSAVQNDIPIVTESQIPIFAVSPVPYGKTHKQ